MTNFEAFILGIIQGLTEFIPVSSSGHMEIGKVLLGVKSEENLLFLVVVHFATLLSTLVVFRTEIINLFKGLLEFQYNDSLDFCLKIFVSIIPVGIIGFLFEDTFEQIFTGKMMLVGFSLLGTALLLFYASKMKETTGEITFLKSIIIGIAQTIALLPGLSRSGATISTALLLKVDRSKAAYFSFMMVLPPIAGAMLLKSLEYIKEPSMHPINLLPLLIGFISAFVFGYIACKWMIEMIKKGKLIYFSVYCLLVGLFAIGMGIF